MSVSQNKVLVLNKSWIAVATATLERAISLLFKTHADGQPKARIIDTGLDFQSFSWADWTALKPADGENVIQGVERTFRIPEIIMLTHYNKIPKRQESVRFSRREIYKRDNYRCQYCGDHIGEDGTIDHILPISQNGDSSWTNCVLACFECNSQKADRTPEMAVRGGRKNWKGPSPMKLLSVPTKPKFSMMKQNRGPIPKSWESFVSNWYWDVELERQKQGTPD